MDGRGGQRQTKRDSADVSRQRRYTYIVCLCVFPSFCQSADLLGTHIQLGAHLTRVTSQQRCWRERAGLLLLLLVHGRHQSEVTDLHHIVHGKEDVGRLRKKTTVLR